MDNGPARKAGVSSALAAAGHLLGDPSEISSLRREDFDFVAPTSPEWDVKQVNTAPSAQVRAARRRVRARGGTPRRGQLSDPLPT